MNNEFTQEELFTDFAGIERRFIYTYKHIEALNMYAVYADEVVDTKFDGYRFSSLKTNIPHALGWLRKKICKRLSTKYLSGDPKKGYFNFDEVVGHIGYGGVVVDGKFLTFKELCSNIQGYEGFCLNLKSKIYKANNSQII